MALGESGRNPVVPRSTAEGAASLRAAGALESDPSVRCPDDLAAGFLGGLNISTLAKHRLTRPLFLDRARKKLPGAYPYESARCRFIDEILLAEVDAGLEELVLLGAGLEGRVDETLARFGLHAEVVLDEAGAARYVTHADGSLVGRPYGFGVLVHARAGPTTEDMEEE